MADFDDAEAYFLDVIFGRKKGFRAMMLRLLFLGLSQIYRVAIMLRLWLFRSRMKRDHNPGCFVISVGNLTMGGTGKTPVVEMLAKKLQAGGRKVAVLSRGYKSRASRKKNKTKRVHPPRTALPERLYFEKAPRIVSDGEQVLMDSRQAGDEPNMLARNLKGVPVVVDKDRVKAGIYAIRNFGADTLILDDGLQYLRLRRRLDIVLVDSNYPFGNEYLIPRGTLREPHGSLRRASCIFLTKCDGSDNSEIIKRMRRYNRTAKIIECTHQPLYLENILTHDRVPLEFLKDKHIASMSGIAVPESFEVLLTRAGAKLEITRRFADHHRFSMKEIQQFIDRCEQRDLALIATTEKDYVRLPPSLQQTDVPIYFLRMEIKVLSGEDKLDTLIARICGPRPPVMASLPG